MACLDSAGVFLRFLVLFSLFVLPGFMIPGCEILFICVCVVHRVVSGLVLMSWRTAAGLHLWEVK